MADTSAIKQALKQAGFEIYRAQAGEVHLAERVRENLIMDSGVRLGAEPLQVVVVLRAQQSDFRGESTEALHGRARKLGAPATARGYRERRAGINQVADPGAPDNIIDRFYEVELVKPVDDFGAAADELRFALGLDKVASR